MKKLGNKSSLRIKESSILVKINNDQVSQRSIERVKNYLQEKDFFNDTYLSLIFEYIYIKRIKITNWKLANLCHVSESTVFRTRHEIVNYFYKCYYEFKRNIITAN